MKIYIVKYSWQGDLNGNFYNVVLFSKKENAEAFLKIHNDNVQYDCEKGELIERTLDDPNALS